MIKQLLLLFVFITGITQLTYTQIKLTLAGKEFVIPHFKADTTVSFNNRFVTDGIIPSIKQSKYELEIRYNFYGAFGWMPLEGHCVVIKGNADSMYVENYFVKQLSGYTLIPQGFKRIDKYDTPQHPSEYYLKISRLSNTEAVAELLNKLISNHIADLPDNKVIIDSLKKNDVLLNDYDGTDCCPTTTIEVKVKGKFRNFTTNAYYQVNNKEIKELNYAAAIDSIFESLGSTVYVVK